MVVTVVGTVVVTVGESTVVVTVVGSVAVTVVVDGGAAAVVVGLEVAGAEVVGGVVVVGLEVAGAEVVGGVLVWVVPVLGAVAWRGSNVSMAAAVLSRIVSATSSVTGWRYQGRRPVCRGVGASKSGTKAGVASASARTSRFRDDMSVVTGIGLRAKAGVASARALDTPERSCGGATPTVGMVNGPAARLDLDRGSGKRQAPAASDAAAANTARWVRRARGASDTPVADGDSWESQAQGASRPRPEPEPKRL